MKEKLNMKNIFERFRNKYKVNDIPVVRKSKISKEEEAKNLTMKLNMLFVAIPLLKPCENDANRVNLSEEHISIIEEVLNSDNELIKNNERYEEIKAILEEILASNKDGIEIDHTFLSKAKKIKVFYYNFQDQKYWKEKPF